MSVAVATSTAPGRIRTARIVALVLGLAAGLLVGGFPALVGGFLESAAEGHKVHDVAWGTFAGLTMAVGYLALARRPERIAPLQQVAVGALALSVGAALSDAVDVFPLIFLVTAAIMWAVHPARTAIASIGKVRPVLALLALVAAARLVPFALDQAELQRVLPASDPHVDAMHYGGVAVMALVIPALALLAALGASGWRVTAWCAGLAAFAFGAISMMETTLPSSAGSTWGAVSLVGGVGFIVAAEILHRSEEGANL